VKPLLRSCLVLMLTAPLLNVSCHALLPFLIAKTQTTQKVRAEYNIPKDKKILALVESSLCETDQPIARMLTDQLNSRLTKEKIAASTVPYSAILDFAAVNPRFGHMRPFEIGRNLKADIVCYVLIQEFRLKDQNLGQLWRGNFQATVALLDVATGKQLWPVAGHEGHWVKPASTPPATESSPDYAAELARSLCESMADNIAKLFCDHEAPLDSEQEQDTDIWSGY
jgi:hypothetical protein